MDIHGEGRHQDGGVDVHVADDFHSAVGGVDHRGDIAGVGAGREGGGGGHPGERLFPGFRGRLAYGAQLGEAVRGGVGDNGGVERAGPEYDAKEFDLPFVAGLSGEHVHVFLFLPCDQRIVFGVGSVALHLCGEGGHPVAGEVGRGVSLFGVEPFGDADGVVFFVGNHGGGLFVGGFFADLADDGVLHRFPEGGPERHGAEAAARGGSRGVFVADGVGDCVVSGVEQRQCD